MSDSTTGASPISTAKSLRRGEKRITLKLFRYVLDWFEIKDREICLDDFAYFYLEHRLGDWYLCHYKYINDGEAACKTCGNYWGHSYSYDFQLVDPVDAILKLGQKLKGYRSLHSNEHFPEVLCKLMESVTKRKAMAA